jgi:hypothetical protein
MHISRWEWRPVPTCQARRSREGPRVTMTAYSSANQKVLYERFRALDDLPRQDQEIALQLIDAIIAKRRMTRLVTGE